MVNLTRIYTRTGDDGTTGLVDGSRTPKTDPRMAAIGDVDEANSAIGVAIVALGAGTLADALTRIQNDMFDLGADLATPGDDFAPGEMTLRVVPAQIAWLEQEIDAMNAELEPLKSFILPAGSPASAHLHLSRTVARRAERLMVALARTEGETVSPAALKYVNRLSDHLFVAARIANDKGRADVLWVPGASR